VRLPPGWAGAPPPCSAPPLKAAARPCRQQRGLKQVKRELGGGQVGGSSRVVGGMWGWHVGMAGCGMQRRLSSPPRRWQSHASHAQPLRCLSHATRQTPASPQHAAQRHARIWVLQRSRGNRGQAQTLDHAAEDGCVVGGPCWSLLARAVGLRQAVRVRSGQVRAGQGRAGQGGSRWLGLRLGVGKV